MGEGEDGLSGGSLCGPRLGGETSQGHLGAQGDHVEVSVKAWHFQRRNEPSKVIYCFSEIGVTLACQRVGWIEREASETNGGPGWGQHSREEQDGAPLALGVGWGRQGVGPHWPFNGCVTLTESFEPSVPPLLPL